MLELAVKTSRILALDAGAFALAAVGSRAPLDPGSTLSAPLGSVDWTADTAVEHAGGVPPASRSGPVVDVSFSPVAAPGAPASTAPSAMLGLRVVT